MAFYYRKLCMKCTWPARTKCSIIARNKFKLVTVHSILWFSDGFANIVYQQVYYIHEHRVLRRTQIETWCKLIGIKTALDIHYIQVMTAMAVAPFHKEYGGCTIFITNNFLAQVRLFYVAPSLHHSCPVPECILTQRPLQICAEISGTQFRWAVGLQVPTGPPLQTSTWPPVLWNWHTDENSFHLCGSQKLYCIVVNPVDNCLAINNPRYK